MYQTTIHPAKRGPIQRDVAAAVSESSSFPAPARAPCSSTPPLGPSWDKHACAEDPADRYDDLRKRGHSAEDAQFTVLIEHRRDGRTVPGQLVDSMERAVKVEKARRASPKKTLYQEVLPEEELDFPGKVMAVERNIKMTKHFGLASTRIARQLLGRLGRGQWHGIRVRGDKTEGQRIVPEAYAFLSARHASALGIREGQRVLLSLVPYRLPGQDPVWVVTETTVR